MQLFCPACQAAFPGASRCPRCGGLLLMPHEVAPDAPHRTTEAPAPVPTTAFGRVAVGVVLALGLYLGLRNLATGMLAAVNPDPAAWWLSFPGLVAMHIVQVIAVVFGGVVAASGRTKGYTVGVAVGAICGGVFVGFEILAGASPRDLFLYLQPPVLALVGFIAGAVGAWVWQPAPHIDYPLSAASKLSSIQLIEDAVAKPEPPTEWIRVILGAFIMVVGVVIADDFRHFAQKHSGGLLRVQSLGQGEFVTWQLGTFAVLMGGIFAGAGTSAGLRHGVYAGFLGGVGVYAMCTKVGIALPPVLWWLTRMSLEEEPLNAPMVMGVIASSVLVAGVLGGWMGGMLLPRLAPESMRTRPRAEA
jgi:hypothetical protein